MRSSGGGATKNKKGEVENELFRHRNRPRPASEMHGLARWSCFEIVRNGAL